MAESAVIGNDQGNCEWLLRVCSLCKKTIPEGTTAHKLADLWACESCYAWDWRNKNDGP